MDESETGVNAIDAVLNEAVKEIGADPIENNELDAAKIQKEHNHEDFKDDDDAAESLAILRQQLDELLEVTGGKDSENQTLPQIANENVGIVEEKHYNVEKQNDYVEERNDIVEDKVDIIEEKFDISEEQLAIDMNTQNTEGVLKSVIENINGEIDIAADEEINKAGVSEKDIEEIPAGETVESPVKEKQKSFNDSLDEDEIDPSLLCPEVSMDVDELTSVDPNLNDKPEPSSTLVDLLTGNEISFELTDEEMKLRATMTHEKEVQFRRTHCTACDKHLGTALEGQSSRFIHPLLKVLICQDCYQFYLSGDFLKDEDGSELYCRWCGQGGRVLCCSTCEFVFCQNCIKRNCGTAALTKIKSSDNWECFRCKPAQLTPVRIACYDLLEYIRDKLSSNNVFLPSFWKMDFSLCCPQRKDGEKPRKKRKMSSEEDPDFYPVQHPDDDLAPVPNFHSKTIIYPRQNVKSPNELPSAQTKQPARPPPIVPGQNHVLQPPPRLVINPISVYNPFAANNQNNFLGYPTIPVRFDVPQLSPTLLTGAPLQSAPNIRINFIQNQQKAPPLMPVDANDWFNKTVRAANRVNSQLSTTMSDLGLERRTASKMNELANIHNKLQEVLSSSINSMIQIRKNLRSEFLNYLKLPSAKLTQINQPTTIVNNNNNNKHGVDDDVIILNSNLGPSTSGLPAERSAQWSSQQKTQLYKVPKLTWMNSSQNFVANPVAASSTSGGFIKVKPIAHLQPGFPKHPITILDDEEEANLVKSIKKTQIYVSNMIKNGQSKVISEIDLTKDKNVKVKKSSKNKKMCVITEKSAPPDMLQYTWNTTCEPDKKVNHMKSVYVKLENIEDLIELAEKDDS